MAGVDLFGEPLPRIIVAVAQQNRARRNLAHKVQQVIAVRVGGQIKLLQVTVAGDRAGAGAEHERVARL